MKITNSNVNSDSPAIMTHDLQLGYGDFVVMNSLTVRFSQGEFIGILGPNGAGKSTFLRALLGLVQPLAGTIDILGGGVHRGDPRIGYMPQSRQLNTHYSLSGLEFVAAAQSGFAWGLPLRNKQQREELRQVLAMVEAESYADRPIQVLSGGERQRLLLAQALLGQPRILLLDEPLAGLDPRHQERLLSLIQSVQQQLRATILFTAHDVNPLLTMMSRVMYMARGNAAIGSVAEIITSERLTALYQSPMDVVQHAGRFFVFSHESSEFEHAEH
jgi:zinc/manganese transport system ATP-binding protein